MTVAFLPELALLFDAHVNVAKIVDEDWSGYLMKYFNKPNPTGDLQLSTDDLFALGFSDVETYKLAVAQRFAITSMYQPAQLALVATDTQTFVLSRDIVFVNTQPPEDGNVRVNVGSFGKPRLDD